MYAVRFSFGAVLLLFFSATLAFAQGTGDIVGRVTDTSGAVLPGVTVTAQNEATTIARTTITSETGDYTFTLLPIGAYTVKIELAGFQSVSSRVELATGDRQVARHARSGRRDKRRALITDRHVDRRCADQ